MELRKIKESELADLLELYQYLHEADLPRPGDSVVNGIWSSIQRSPNLHYFGAFNDGALISTCTLSVILNLTRGCKPYGVIENVVTAPELRRRGFGTAVLTHTLNHAWKEDCYKVMLLTGRKDEATYQFYESSGFNRHEKQAFIAKHPTL